MRLNLIPKKQFFRDYRLPLEATFLFAVIIAVMLFGRAYDRLALADVLGSTTGNGKDYATLLSNDKADAIKKNDVSSQDNTKTEASSSPSATTPFSVSPTPPPADPAPTDNPPDTGGDDPVPPPPPPPPPFGAVIDNLAMEGAFLECSGGTGSTDCSKRYVFKAVVHAYNGPGSIVYSWQGTRPEIYKDGNLTVGTGETLTPVYRDFRLPCNQPTMFSIKVVITQPYPSQSQTLTMNHFCGTT